MGIKSKLRTAFWYLKRPKFYLQFVVLLRKKIFRSRKEDSGVFAIKWCEERAIDTFQLLHELLGNEQLQPITEKYKDIFIKARQISESVPVKMGGGGDISLLYYLSDYVDATRVIETGVAHGWSSLALLLSLSKRKDSLLISTDMPYAKLGNEDYVGCVLPDNLQHNWRLIRKPDISGLPEAFKIHETIDLCHYDSDKSYSGRMWAYPKLWERLRSGGAFVSDDIGDNMAFAEFCQEIKKEPIVIKFGRQYVGVIFK